MVKKEVYKKNKIYYFIYIGSGFMESNKMKNIISTNRKRKKLTQEDLASLVGVSKSVVSKWELGMRFPDITLIPVLAEILEVSIEEFFSGIPSKREKIVIYDEVLISSFKKNILFSIIMIIAPLFCMIGTLVKSLELFFLLLGAGIVLAIIGIIRVLENTKKLKEIIVRESNKPKYSIIYKNYLIMILFILFVEVFVLLSYFASNHMILFSTILYVLFLVFTVLSFIDIGFEVMIKRFVILLIPSIILLILSLLLMILISPFPYCILMLFSQIINFIMFSIQNNYVK